MHKTIKNDWRKKKLTQKSYDVWYKICSLYLCYYIEDKTKRLESCEKILNKLIDNLEVKRYISKLKKIYKL